MIEVIQRKIDILVETENIVGYRFYIDEDDKQTIRFVYPQLFSDEALCQEIRLEIGSLAAWTPLTNRVIIPYVAEEFPNVFQISNTLIRIVERKEDVLGKSNNST